MNDKDLLRRREKIAVLEAETLAARIRMEAMKAGNRQTKLSGGKKLPYLETDYQTITDDICAAMARFAKDADDRASPPATAPAPPPGDQGAVSSSRT